MAIADWLGLGKDPVLERMADFFLDYEGEAQLLEFLRELAAREGLAP